MVFSCTQTWDLNEIRAHLPALNSQLPTRIDSCIWTLTKDGKFSISSLSEQLRLKFPINDWNHIVWFPSYIPKCSLIAWIAIQNRLSTEDRLVLFGVKTSSNCSFCPGEETHDHLFFNCPFTRQVWVTVSLKSQFTWQPQSLSTLVTLISTMKGRGLKNILAKLTFIVTLYHIWLERNRRKFQGLHNGLASIVVRICTDIRYRLMSLHKLPHGSLTLLESWNIAPH